MQIWLVAVAQCKWALSKIDVSVMPGKALYIALFISELAKRSSENNTGVYNAPFMLLSGATRWLVSRLVLLAIPWLILL